MMRPLTLSFTIQRPVAALAVAVTTMACLTLHASPSTAVFLAVNDGRTHVYNAQKSHPWDALLIRNVGCPYPPGDACANPGTPTTAIVQPFAQIYSMQGRDSSTVVVNGGDLGFLQAHHDSHVTMHGGSVHDAWTSLMLASGVLALDRSTLVVSGGYIDGHLGAYGTPIVAFDGGHIAKTIQAGGSSTLTMNGGQVDGFVGAFSAARVAVHGGSMSDVLANDRGEIVVTGGTIASTVYARDDSQVWIVGSGFAIDGVPTGLGDIVATSGVLTGVLENGDALNVAFRQGELATGQIAPLTGTITLAPEPGSGVLVGLGMAWLGGRARRRPRGPVRSSLPT